MSLPFELRLRDLSGGWRHIEAVGANLLNEFDRHFHEGIMEPETVAPIAADPGVQQAVANRLDTAINNMTQGLLLFEPRGSAPLSLDLVVPPCHPDADAGFVIMEQVEYPPMSGTNTICVTTALLETGIIPMREPVTEPTTIRALPTRTAGVV